MANNNMLHYFLKMLCHFKRYIYFRLEIVKKWTL